MLSGGSGGNLLAIRETWVRSLGWEDLPGESPWTKESGGLQSKGSQGVRHDWVTKRSTTSRFLTEAGRAVGDWSILTKAMLPRLFVTSSRRLVSRSRLCIGSEYWTDSFLRGESEAAFPLFCIRLALLGWGHRNTALLILGILCFHKIFTPLGILAKEDAKFNFKDMKSGADGKFWH